VLSRALLTRKAVEVAGAIGVGIALWRFTSGYWISGLAFTAAVGALVAWYLFGLRARPGKRRY
jgi:hypothetical protein